MNDFWQIPRGGQGQREEVQQDKCLEEQSGGGGAFKEAGKGKGWCLKKKVGKLFQMN